MSESPYGSQIDLLKPHLQAIVDGARRTGSEAALAAFYEIEAKLPEEVRAKADSPASGRSCGALHVLAAVASSLGFDAL